MFASSKTTRERRPGFTIIELLVVIAVIALLFALLLPAIQVSRGGGGKNHCRNNIKQLGLALQNHNDMYKTFPPLMFTNIAAERGNLDAQTAAIADRQYSFIVRLLPFIEEDVLYKQLSTSSGSFSKSADDPALLVTSLSGSNLVRPESIYLNQLICPAFSGDSDYQGLAVTNYVALSATTEGKLTPQGDFDPEKEQNRQTWGDIRPDGMLIPDPLGRGQSMARMSDGTSKTAVLVESREGGGVSPEKVTHVNSWYRGSQPYVYAFPPSRYPGANDVGFQSKTSLENFTPGAVTALNFGPHATSIWSGGDAKRNPGNDGKLAYKTSSVPGPAPRDFGPSSDHPGEIIILALGDGSVQEIRADTDPAALYAIVTARGGEMVQPGCSGGK